MLNPLSGIFEGPKGEKGSCKYKGTFGEGAYECRSSYIDTPTRLEFWVAVQDDPPGGPIPAATWAVLDRRAIAPDDTFVSMGNEDMLGGSPRQLDPLLQLAKTRLNFVAGREYFVNMWLCDEHQNCEMAWSMPLTLDMTPPPVPSIIIADYSTNTSANGLDYYFVKKTMIKPAWNTQNGVGTSGGITSPWNDPESGKVRTRWSVVKNIVGGEPKPVVRPRLANGDGYSMFGESHISSNTLEHGATYFVQLLMQNGAGGVARTVSRPIKADFTKPVCASPRIYATCAAAGCVGANVKQNVVPSGVVPVSGTPYAGTRSFSWIGANLDSFIVDFNQTTCTDPESGFFALDFALGRFSGDASLLEKRRIMQRTTTTIQVDFPLGEVLMDSAECSDCGRPIHLNIWCTNGALQTITCLQMPRLRVDGSPPTCPGTGMRLGDGLYDGFQVGLATLRVRNMHEVRDAETGVRRVDYNLLDVNTSVSTALSQVSGVGLPSRDFDVTGVNLAHDHVYRIRATVTNGIGNTVECNSSDVRVDTTPPVRGRVFVLQREAEAQLDTPSRHSFAGSARTMLLAQRGFHDPESALGEQYVGIFLTDGTPIVEERRVPPLDWVGFNVALSHRVSYYASWRYENKAQLSTMAFSNVITVDLTPPTVIPCLDVIEDANLVTLSGSAWWERVLPNDEVDYVGSTEFSLSVRFEGSDEDSGIAEAKWCIGTIPGACDAAPAGIIDHREMMATRSLVLQDMTIYYQSVQFMNRAGLFNMAVSNGFMVDVSPPVCGQVLDGPAYDRAYIGPSSIEGLSWIIEELPLPKLNASSPSAPPPSLPPSAPLHICGWARGTTLNVNQPITDALGRVLVLQSDGNVAIYTNSSMASGMQDQGSGSGEAGSGISLWETGTTDIARIVYLSDTTIVGYRSDDSVAWATGSTPLASPQLLSFIDASEVVWCGTACYASLGGLAASQGLQIQGWSSGYSLSTCKLACDTRSNCNSFSFSASSGACYLKEASHTASSSSSSNDLTTYYTSECSSTSLPAYCAGTGSAFCPAPPSTPPPLPPPPSPPPPSPPPPSPPSESGWMSNNGALSDLAFAELDISWSDFADHGGGIAGYSAAIVPAALHGLANTSNTRFVDVGIASPLGASARRGLLLAHNQMYYGVVSAYDLLGNEVKCYSNGVLVDFTPPNMTLASLRSLLAPAGAQNVQPFAHTIHVEVTGVDDPESGIVQYYAAMGNASGVEAVRPFRMAGTEQGEVLIGGLDLYDGFVDVTIRAVNGALEQADVTMSVGVDTGVPVCSAVVIGANAPGQAIQYTTDGTQVEARWNCSDVAPWADSALSCSWAVGTFPGGDDAMPWAVADSQGSHSWLNASLEDGRFYWVTVTCTDHVGWQVSSISGALVPDLLPPTVSVQPRIVTRLGRAASFWSSRDEIAAVWGFDDLVSGIRQIRASVSVDARVPPMSEMPLGLSTDPMVRHALIPLEDAGILLSHNTRYYLHVCAEDHANHSVCAESATVLVDLTPPVCEIPIDMAAGIVAPNITSLQMGVSGSWHCRDPESGVASSSWMPYAGTASARGDSLLAAPVNIKGGAGSSTMAVRLASGNIYRGCVTSLNGAGLVSFVGGTCSIGMAYDGTAPRSIHKHISDLGGRAFLPAPSQLCTDWPSWCVNRS